MVDAFHIKSGHITHDALHWPIDLHFRHEQVGKYPRWIASLLVPVVLGFALDSRNPTAFVGIGSDRTISLSNRILAFSSDSRAMDTSNGTPGTAGRCSKGAFLCPTAEKDVFSKRRNCSSGCPLSCKEASPEFLRIVP